MATLRALAFVLNGAVFLVGVGRAQGHLAPPDFVYLGLMFAAPLVSSTALALGFRQARRDEPHATLRAMGLILNVALLAFVFRLLGRLDPGTREEQALWLGIMAAAPFVNAPALFWSGRRTAAVLLIALIASGCAPTPSESAKPMPPEEISDAALANIPVVPGRPSGRNYRELGAVSWPAEGTFMLFAVPCDADRLRRAAISLHGSRVDAIVEYREWKKGVQSYCGGAAVEYED